MSALCEGEAGEPEPGEREDEDQRPLDRDERREEVGTEDEDEREHAVHEKASATIGLSPTRSASFAAGTIVISATTISTPSR